MEHEHVTSEKLDDPYTNESYLYAIDLYNHEYYWESHVWWESLWHLEGRRGDTADLLKALIKLAAGRLKARMGQTEVAEDHFKRAEELFNNLPSPLMGVDIDALKSDSSHITLI